MHSSYTCNVPSVCIPPIHVMLCLCAFSYNPLCPFVPLYDPLCPFMPLYAPLSPFMPLYDPLYPFIPLYAPLCPFTPLYTSLHAFTCFYMLCKLRSSQDLIVGLVYIKKRSQLLLFMFLNTTHLLDGFGESRNGLE